MRTGRWVASAVASVLLAALPGLIVFVTESRPLDRSDAAAPGAPAAVPLHAPVTTSAPASTTTAAPPPATTPPPPPDEVPVIPPTGPMTGEVAAASEPVSHPFERSEAGSGEVLALIVGIDDYPGSRHDLDAAVADAGTIDAALAGFGVPRENRVVLRDGQARRHDLVEALKALVRRAGRGSTVVFAFAGHVQKLGPGTEAIITADGEHLVDSELATILAPARAERMWLLIASCYAAGFTEALAPGRVLTAAADARSLAYESPSLGGSYLVHYMVREGWLQGRAGDSVQDAFRYADAAIAARHPGRRPVQIDHGRTDLRLGGGGTSTTTSSQQHDGPRPSSAPTTSPTVPPTTTTTAPERRCALIILC